MNPSELNDNETQEAAPSRKGALIKFFIFLILLLIVLGAGYYYWRKHHQQYKAVQAQTVQKVQNTQQRLAALTRTQQQIMAQQQAILQKLQAHGISDEQLILTSVIELLEYAQLELSIKHNLNAAIMTLQFAENKLEQVNSYQLNNIQTLVAADIAHLKNIKMVNMQNLQNHVKQIDSLITKLSLNLQQQTVAKAATESTAKGWRKAWDNAVAALKNIVVVERTDKSYVPLMDQTLLQLLKQHLQILLQQAQWAAYNQQNTYFHDSLQQLSQELHHSFTMSNEVAQKIDAAIEKLQDLNVEPALPENLLSLTAAHKLQHKMLLPNKGNAK